MVEVWGPKFLSGTALLRLDRRFGPASKWAPSNCNLKFGVLVDLNEDPAPLELGETLPA